MKQHFKTKTITLLTLLCIGMGGARAQIDLRKNEDGSVDKKAVIESFEAYLDQKGVAATDNEQLLDSIVKAYLYTVFPDSNILIREEGSVSSDDAWEQMMVTNRCSDEMKELVKNRKQLEEPAVDEKKPLLDFNRYQLMMMGLGVLCLLLIVILVSVVRKRKKRVVPNTQPQQSVPSNSDIVVRRKTSTVLRKQNIDDVVGNDGYMVIDTDELCVDSAVRRIYVKALCIKDIYNMYAEDLRNPNNPKEDGCMVLGRWIFDKSANEYDVTLEQVVFPGDDAVFTEFELNFGAKIVMSVREKLRKLRQEADLQYDLTCWVHSHPGLGVFFSNSDCNVQNQLKHASHPHFLTAIVVDILTPQQELGIFTFKHDGAINSRPELKRLYSLEEWYQWAVEHERKSFKADDFNDTLREAGLHVDGCHGIQLSNSAIIDMGLMTTENQGVFIAKVFGYAIERKGVTEFAAMKVSVADAVADYDLVGCFVMDTYCSIPSLRKAVAPLLSSIKFVLVYSTNDGMLTSIPVIGGTLCNDEKYYGEQQLEDLKIWTRRKR